jgi:hypothetical protein
MLRRQDSSAHASLCLGRPSGSALASRLPTMQEWALPASGWHNAQVRYYAAASRTPPEKRD